MLIAVWVVVGVLAVALLVLGSLFLQLLRQQGRVLLRIEALEQASAISPQLMGNGAEAKPGSLPLATPFPPFRLPDLTGRTVQLEDLRGRRILLVHWDPACGFCGSIARELAGLQGDLRAHKTELVLVSYGGAETNQRFAEEHGLECSILLQEDGHPLEALGHLGTPVAYLLDEMGRVAKQVAVGANEVPELARAAAGRRAHLVSERPLSESRLEREGLRAGTTAPSFSLPDLNGRTVSLTEFRGLQLLLVFSDPTCRPCDELAARLARLEREVRGDGLRFVMVSRGGVDENRRKATEHGIEFPVAIQPGWRVSKQYGIFVTPVAFLIDEEGVIAADVARGSEEIVQLARHALVAREEAPIA